MIENKITNFPSDLQIRYQVLDQSARSFIEKNDYIAAEQEYRTLLSEILEAQGTTTRFHKGGIYHQLGVCLYLQNKSEEALPYFKYAFIEDCVSEIGVQATQLPAYHNLYYVYKISAKQLAALLSKIKQDIVIDVPQNPIDYLKAYLDSGSSLDSNAVVKRNNVFIGGNYKNIALLMHIADHVRERDFSPIMALDFDVAKDEDIYADAMALLQDCCGAIFEITFDAGHLMEIERAINSKLFPKENILLLFQKRKNSKDHYISKMLLGVQISPVGYMKIEELPGLINDFLGKIKRDI
jgi:hypothetical protein